MGLKLKDSEVIPFQPEFARNIPLDENEERNGEKAASLIMMIGISGGGKMQSWFLQIYNMSTVRYWTDLVRTHRRPSVCKEKRQPHNSSAGFLYWRTHLWFCIVFQLFNPGLLRLHRAVHNVACGGSPLWRLCLRGDDGVLPDNGRLRRLLHHHARPDRLRHLRTRGRWTGHRLPPRSLLPTTHRGTSCCRVHLWSGAPANFESLMERRKKN